MWWNIAINLAFAVVASLLYEPPPGPKSLTAEDLSVPKSVEGDPIYDIAGTAWIDDAHVVWDGDFKSRPIYKRGGKK